MLSKNEILPKENAEEDFNNIETITSEEENSENLDKTDSPHINLASYITTPYERVLSIINEAKAFILSVSSTQQKLIKGLEWVIKVISSHNLYAYELKDQESSNENEEYKQFVQFVNSYKDEIQTNKKPTGKGKNFLISSLNLKRPKALNYSIFNFKKKKLNQEEEKIDKVKNENKIIKNKEIIENKNINKNEDKKTDNKTNINNNIKNVGLKTNIKSKFDKNKNNEPVMKTANKNKKINYKKNETPRTQKNAIPTRSEKKIKTLSPVKVSKINVNNILTPKPKIKSKDSSKSMKQYEDISPQIIKKTSHFQSEKMVMKYVPDELNLLKEDSNRLFTHYSSNILEKALIDINYPPSRIIEKTFNIFELKEIVGQDNILPIMGKVILDSFGLYSDDIISVEKLDPFLVSISKQYLKTTLYHNSMHGADVTQSLALYFLNSNAEEICQSLVLDLLGILIAALGHDLAHPGLTNPFHINSSSELAITYNDISCLENFHTSKLFRTIRNPETNIFEKLSIPDYKTIRKRMIGYILATDMANHGKIMTVIKSKIAINKAENNTKFELLSGNEKAKFEEQQSLFDFLIHAADLAHNTKAFNISIKWVELLTEEFWLQGDKEKSMNLPVSFLCDRDSYNVPQSQVGFLKGFIIPTFECMIDIFPSLKYAMDNAKINLKKWERLCIKGRLKGWTPEKTKKVNYKEKITLFSAITPIKDKNVATFKRKSGNVNSLSHAFQVKELDNIKEQQNDYNNEKKKKEGINKIQKPNIINKKKNNDKITNIHKLPKFK